jgi:FKBP-type peptidyl-prolyl cis-trans isomerase FklB
MRFMDINMKKLFIITALLCSAVLSFGQELKVEKNDTLSYLLGVNLGEMIKSNDFPVEAIDMRVLIQGLEDALQAKLPVSDPDFESQYLYSPYLINEVFNRAIEENKTRKAAENLERGNKYLELLSTLDGVEVTESGLHYIIIRPGQGALVRPEDTVVLNYKGMFVDGTVFDENTDFEFQANKVVPGMTEGLTKIAKGGKIRLFIPPHLAYGEKGVGPIGPNVLLIFEIEVLDIVAE